MTLDEIRFLTFQDAIDLHADQINRYGGSHGIRDEGLLRSALSQPEAQFGGSYLHDSIATMAAAYLFHLVQNHPFIDGNKRIGAACATAFLELNGFTLDPTIDELEAGTTKTRFETVVLSVANGRMSKETLRQWIEATIQASD